MGACRDSKYSGARRGIGAPGALGTPRVVGGYLGGVRGVGMSGVYWGGRTLGTQGALGVWGHFGGIRGMSRGVRGLLGLAGTLGIQGPEGL